MANPYALLLLFFTSLGMAQYQSSDAHPELGNGIHGMFADSHGLLVEAFEIAGLGELLESDNSLTFFTPSKEAFGKWSAESLAYYRKPENRQALRALLTYHIVLGKLTASRILLAMCRGAGTASFTTVQGNEILASMEGTDILLTDCSGNTARIQVADSIGNNRVVHLIDRVIEPR